MKIGNYLKITEWIVNSDSRIEEKRPKLCNLNQTQNIICSFNLNNPELTVFIAFKMTDISSKIKNSLIVNTDRESRIC